jgi:uncharacterized oxidoreductase
MQIDDKVVLITGASSGLGAALAHHLLEQGARVVLAGRRRDRLGEVLARSPAPDRGLALPTDVTRHEQLETLVVRAVERFGGLHIIVNNAGLGLTAPLEDLEPEEIESLVRLNLLAPIWLTRLALPHLLAAEEGMVVSVSSMSALAALPLQAVYCAAKAGLGAFDNSLRRDLRGTGVRVLTAYPAVLDTEMLDGMRERAVELGVRAPMYSPERVAKSLVRAMRRERRSVILGGVQDRVLAWLASHVPTLLDGPLHRLRPTLADLGAAGAAVTRSRLSPPEDQ